MHGHHVQESRPFALLLQSLQLHRKGRQVDGPVRAHGRRQGLKTQGGEDVPDEEVSWLLHYCDIPGGRQAGAHHLNTARDARRQDHFLRACLTLRLPRVEVSNGLPILLGPEHGAVLHQEWRVPRVLKGSRARCLDHVKGLLQELGTRLANAKIEAIVQNLRLDEGRDLLRQIWRPHPSRNSGPDRNQTLSASTLQRPYVSLVDAEQVSLMMMMMMLLLLLKMMKKILPRT
mmetsp:Transcript_9427/g.26810  ORF Transcript_9427/g.26810 Transcript_9427/m.26810 type:complete len:231 (+) Transcript_9427:740-1432(+)